MYDINNPIGVSYSPSGDGLVGDPKDLMAKNYQYRIVNNFEKIPTISTQNDNLISLDKKNFYFKQIGDSTVSSTSVEFLSLNNSWLNQNKCTIVKP